MKKSRLQLSTKARQSSTRWCRSHKAPETVKIPILSSRAFPVSSSSISTSTSLSPSSSSPSPPPLVPTLSPLSEIERESLNLTHAESLKCCETQNDSPTSPSLVNTAVKQSDKTLSCDLLRPEATITSQPAATTFELSPDDKGLDHVILEKSASSLHLTNDVGRGGKAHKPKKQTSLFSFLGSKSAAIKRPRVSSPKPSRHLHTPIYHDNKDLPVRRFSQNAKRSRPCPFYKKIPGTPFTVDAFQYGSIPDCKVYFLSHFHADHYTGLRKSFQHPIYCSQITGNLVQHQLKVSGAYVHPLTMNVPHLIEEVEVTLLDANHCPGSVLLLFRLKSGLNYLHTGDFRFSPSMLDEPSSNPLASLTIHQLYLDTTYCSPQYTFPPQEETIAFAVEKSLDAMNRCPNTLIVCGTYTIGKEKVFMAIADVLGIKVCVSKEKKAILDCLEIPSLSDILTTNYNESPLHVLPMGKLNLKNLGLYLEKWAYRYSQLLAFKPTGWSHSSKKPGLSSLQAQIRDAISLYGIPYSEHSSFDELKRCVQALEPLKIIPTVNNFSVHKREEMQRLLRNGCKKWKMIAAIKRQQ